MVRVKFYRVNFFPENEKIGLLLNYTELQQNKAQMIKFLLTVYGMIKKIKRNLQRKDFAYENYFGYRRIHSQSGGY